MARIRSIHPGFFTDERLVSTSCEARLLFLGLGVEADDKGVFEWKPVTLKMRLFPADNIDIAEKLAELVEVGVIASYEIGGRQYGAIRNFRRHQRPKTPNDVHPIPDDFRKYVGLTGSVSETSGDDDPSFPPKGEKPPQMEDGGWREGEGGRKPTGFPARKGAQKRTGFVKVRTPADAAEALIDDIDNEFGRTERSDAFTGETVRLIPAVRTG